MRSSAYAAYMRSPKWRETRERYRRSKLPQNCQGCGKRRQAGHHLHHRTYVRLGHERLTDLIPLCPTCHKKVHADYKQRTSGSLQDSTTKTLKRLRTLKTKPRTRNAPRNALGQFISRKRNDR